MGEVDTKEVIAARLGVSGEMLRLVAKRFAETGGDVRATISRKKRDRPPVPSPVTGEVEARLIVLSSDDAVSDPTLSHWPGITGPEVGPHVALGMVVTTGGLAAGVGAPDLRRRSPG
ncbi:MAG: hypothetical protein ABIQ18_33355 [Umezawaea sp.]